jgi:malonyl CoA-acyl carrier protein transacylase
MPATAIMCPGQGSLTAGARELVEDVAPDLLELLDEDPFGRAHESTRYAQPAIFCASIAGWRLIENDVQPAAAAGHSLGELTALAIAGVLNVEDALRLVVLRGRVMAEAASDGGMLALLKATPEQAAALAAEHGAVVANDNAPGQLVLSGPRRALDNIAAAAREQRVRALQLDVTGAFHSPEMRPATAPLLRALTETRLAPGRFPVYSGLTARPFTDVRGQLADAVTQPVRWRETVLALHEDGAERFVDVGPGEVLARLVERIVSSEERVHVRA